MQFDLPCTMCGRSDGRASWSLKAISQFDCPYCVNCVKTTTAQQQKHSYTTCVTPQFKWVLPHTVGKLRFLWLDSCKPFQDTTNQQQTPQSNKRLPSFGNSPMKHLGPPLVHKTLTKNGLVTFTKILDLLRAFLSSKTHTINKQTNTYISQATHQKWPIVIHRLVTPKK